MKILKTWSMTKKRSSEIFAAKMEIFSERNVILVGEKFFRPPKLGARFPPLHLKLKLVKLIDYPACTL